MLLITYLFKILSILTHVNGLYIILSIIIYFCTLQHLQRSTMRNYHNCRVKLCSLNCHIQAIAGDGNCLFHSVADQLQNNPYDPIELDHKQLCGMVVDYMRDNHCNLEVKLQDMFPIKILLKTHVICNKL